MPRGGPEAPLLTAIEEGRGEPVYLVTGEGVLAEAASRRIAQALAQRVDATPRMHRRPPGLADVLADLRTYSLFGGGKVSLVVDSAVLTDRRGAAHLVDQAEEALPVSPQEPLSGAGREAAGRLLQVCRLFGVEPYSGSPPSVLEQLPDWAFAGGVAPGSRARPKRRSKARVAALREGLADLLQAAAGEGIEGWAESDVTDLASIVREGLPAGHALVLCEPTAAPDHPLVEELGERHALLELSRIESDRRGRWRGLGELGGELERETGVPISREALAELARRTLRLGGQGGRRRDQGLDPDSSVRLAGEYRKLATLASGARIETDLVRSVVEDRGEEDVWALLDAIGAGRCGEALERLHRLLEGADDATAARLGFFARLAGFCHELTAVSGMIDVAGVPRGETSYPRFKSKLAPKLQGELPDSGSEYRPLGQLHPFRLHRAYLAASRMAPSELALLPARVLETELRLKGESSDPDAALAAFVSWLATAGRRA